MEEAGLEACASIGKKEDVTEQTAASLTKTMAVAAVVEAEEAVVVVTGETGTVTETTGGEADGGAVIHVREVVDVIPDPDHVIVDEIDAGGGPEAIPVLAAENEDVTANSHIRTPMSKLTPRTPLLQTMKKHLRNILHQSHFRAVQGKQVLMPPLQQRPRPNLAGCLPQPWLLWQRSDSGCRSLKVNPQTAPLQHPPQRMAVVQQTAQPLQRTSQPDLPQTALSHSPRRNRG